MLWAVGLAFGGRLMFHPPEPRCTDDRGAFVISSAAGEHTGAAWIERPDAKLVVLLSHGNAEDVHATRSVIDAFVEMGFSVLAYDYGGFGASDGSPSESRAYRDIDAAYDWLTTTRGIDARRIIAVGRSIGSGPSVDLAARRPLGGLLLDSPFLSAFRVLTQVPLFPFDRFVNADKIASVRCPLLVVHARDDHVVPFWQGEELFRRATAPKQRLWLDDGGHTGAMRSHATEYERAVRRFASQVEANAEL